MHSGNLKIFRACKVNVEELDLSAKLHVLGSPEKVARYGYQPARGPDAEADSVSCVA
jgi:hypothetical protein